MPKAAWALDVRDRALAIYLEGGPAEASRQTGVPSGTISQWARRAGVTLTRNEQTRAATETSAQSRDERVMRLAENLLSDAERLREFLWKPVTVILGDEKLGIREMPQFADQKNILLSTAIAIDKAQLLTGKATVRVESVEQPQRETLGKLLQLRQAS